VEKLTDASTMANHKSAMYKIKAILKTAEKDLLEDMDSNIEVFKNLNQSHLPANDYIQSILNSIVQKNVLSLAYFAHHSQENTKRDIDPVGIFYQDSYWHLIAYCRLRKDYRDFRIDRIKSLRVTNEFFASQHPTLKQYIAKTAKEKHLDTVIIKVEKSVYPNLSQQKYYSGFVSEKTIGDCIEMTFLTTSLEGFARWFMMFGDQGVIIEPNKLRARVKEITEKLIQNNL
jgi:predicted DNA-binding transcriptional regulator YafY